MEDDEAAYEAALAERLAERLFLSAQPLHKRLAREVPATFAGTGHVRWQFPTAATPPEDGQQELEVE